MFEWFEVSTVVDGHRRLAADGNGRVHSDERDS